MSRCVVAGACLLLISFTVGPVAKRGAAVELRKTWVSRLIIPVQRKITTSQVTRKSFLLYNAGFSLFFPLTCLDDTTDQVLPSYNVLYFIKMTKFDCRFTCTSDWCLLPTKRTRETCSLYFSTFSSSCVVSSVETERCFG